MTNEFGHKFHYEIDPNTGNVLSINSSDFEESWHNPRGGQDVNEDGTITALDALRVINELERVTDNPHRDSHLDPATIENRETRRNKKYDTNHDGQVTALDALRVINRLAQVNVSKEVGVALSEAEVNVQMRYAGSADYLAAGGTDDSTSGTKLPSTLPGYVDTITTRGVYRTLYQYSLQTTDDHTQFGNVSKITELFKAAGSDTFLEQTYTEFTYDSFGYLDTITELLSAGQTREVDYDYDRNGRLVKLVQPIDVGLDQVSDFRYDAFDNLIASSVTNVVPDVVETPQNESATQILTNYYAYDAIGRVTAVAQANPDLPAGGENTIDDYGVQGPQFSRAGLPASWDNRAVTFYTYDGNSNVTQTSTYDGGNDRVTMLEYDKLDRLIKLTQPQVTAYDSHYTPGNPIPTAGSVTPTTLFLYDNLGNLKGVHDPLGNETFFHYDQWNRQIASISNPRSSQFTVSDRSSLLGDTAFVGFSTDPVTGATISRIDYAPVDVAAGLQEDTNGDQVLERVGVHSWQITHTDPLQNVTEVTTDFLGRT
ncbi:MAG: dockerin type I domain-containing protein, partial [Pirellulales bacterium]|nr:dockerin type I domain-containing protein [Pirellulales bacterium]